MLNLETTYRTIYGQQGFTSGMLLSNRKNKGIGIQINHETYMYAFQFADDHRSNVQMTQKTEIKRKFGKHTL